MRFEMQEWEGEDAYMMKEVQALVVYSIRVLSAISR
jgi:hypothetical protein